MSSRGGLQLTVKLLKGNEAGLTAQAAALGLTMPGLSPLYGATADKQAGWILGFSALTRAEIVQAVNKLTRLAY